MTYLLRVNMSTQAVTTSELPPDYQRLGGRALTSRICQDEVDPFCYALGERNKLVIAPGLLAAADFPYGGRIAMAGKSPLTQGLTASNAGGLTAARLGALGIQAIVVEGLPQDDKLYVLVISEKEARLVPTPELRGKGTSETTARLQEKYGTDSAVAAIGPAGEMLLTAAAITNADLHGLASRINGRGGLGAVMGAKRLKAIVIENASPPKAAADSGRFKAAVNEFEELLKGNSRKNAPLAETALQQNCLPSGSAAVNGAQAKLGAPVKPETARAFRQYCEITDWTAISELNETANDLGLDTLETAAALAVLMQAEMIPWGDGKAALQMIKEVREGTSLGYILGQGGSFAAEAFNVQLSEDKVVSKAAASGSAARDKQFNVCIAAALQNEQEFPGRRQGELQDELGADMPLLTNHLLDTLGVCLYAAPAFTRQPTAWSTMAELLNARYGWEQTAESLLALSRDALLKEREFDAAAGYLGESNRLGGYLPLSRQDHHTHSAVMWQQQSGSQPFIQ
ncbi:MAG TPA: aldehyde ferredoxin oxidoreductase N-terminal domain-containing protein [Oscillospiraceae bacterium]|nr:aldehyde ferredoxin oxidoreductase N-terminal domain-containing protein [Oscillospiraceae bacterium]